MLHTRVMSILMHLRCNELTKQRKKKSALFEHICDRVKVAMEFSRSPATSRKEEDTHDRTIDHFHWRSSRRVVTLERHEKRKEERYIGREKGKRNEEKNEERVGVAVKREVLPWWLLRTLKIPVFNKRLSGSCFRYRSDRLLLRLGQRVYAWFTCPGRGRGRRGKT